MLTSYHIKPEEINYTQKTYEVIRQLAIKSAKELNHSNCVLNWNYYADNKYFAYEEQCKEKIGQTYIYPKKIVLIDIQGMSYKRYWSTQFK